LISFLRDGTYIFFARKDKLTTIKKSLWQATEDISFSKLHKRTPQSPPTAGFFRFSEKNPV